MASSFVNRGFSTFKRALEIAPEGISFVDEMAKRNSSCGKKAVKGEMGDLRALGFRS